MVRAFVSAIHFANRYDHSNKYTLNSFHRDSETTRQAGPMLFP